jgi:hypothetical protein
MLGRTPNLGIVGGGIGGMAAALALQRAGIDVTVYEQADEMREAGAGLMLWPNGSRVVRELGLLDEVIARSGPNTHFLVQATSGKVLMDIPLGKFDAPAMCIRRADLLAVLLAAFPAATDLPGGRHRRTRRGDRSRWHSVAGANRTSGRDSPRLPRLHHLARRGPLRRGGGFAGIQQRNLGPGPAVRAARYGRRPVHLVRHGQFAGGP